MIIMKLCVCSTYIERCIMLHCKDCPGQQGLIDYITNVLSFDLFNMELPFRKTD